MGSSKAYLSFILEQLSGLPEVTYRAMMGEYILYHQGKIAAYICDDRLLVKPTATACALLPQAPREKPYEGAKEMLLVERVDEPEFLRELVQAVTAELPPPKRKKGR